MVPNVRGSGGGRLIEHQKPNQPVNLELVDGSEWFLGKLRDFITSYTDSLSRRSSKPGVTRSSQCYLPIFFWTAISQKQKMLKWRTLAYICHKHSDNHHVIQQLPLKQYTNSTTR